MAQDISLVLPLEIWGQCMEEACHGEQYMSNLLIFTTVSTRWRDLALGTPSLWATIHVKDAEEDLLATIAVFLNLSMDFPLTLGIWMSFSKNWNVICAMFLPHAHRVRKVTLHTNSQRNFPSAISDADRVLKEVFHGGDEMTDPWHLTLRGAFHDKSLITSVKSILPDQVSLEFTVNATIGCIHTPLLDTLSLSIPALGIFDLGYVLTEIFHGRKEIRHPKPPTFLAFHDKHLITALDDSGRKLVRLRWESLFRKTLWQEVTTIAARQHNSIFPVSIPFQIAAIGFIHALRFDTLCLFISSGIPTDVDQALQELFNTELVLLRPKHLTLLDFYGNHPVTVLSAIGQNLVSLQLDCKTETFTMALTPRTEFKSTGSILLPALKVLHVATVDATIGCIHAPLLDILCLSITAFRQADADRALMGIFHGGKEMMRPKHLTLRASVHDKHVIAAFRTIGPRLVSLELGSQLPYSKTFWMEMAPSATPQRSSRDPAASPFAMATGTVRSGNQAVVATRTRAGAGSVAGGVSPAPRNERRHKESLLPGLCYLVIDVHKSPMAQGDAREMMVLLMKFIESRRSDRNCTKLLRVACKWHEEGGIEEIFDGLLVR